MVKVSSIIHCHCQSMASKIYVVLLCTVVTGLSNEIPIDIIMINGGDPARDLFDTLPVGIIGIRRTAYHLSEAVGLGAVFKGHGTYAGDIAVCIMRKDPGVISGNAVNNVCLYSPIHIVMVGIALAVHCPCLTIANVIICVICLAVYACQAVEIIICICSVLRWVYEV